MPQIKHDYQASTYDSKKHIDELNREIGKYCETHPTALTTEEGHQALLSRLLRRSGMAAYRGAKLGEGGPFGAMLVDFHTEDGIPVVVGYGTNHVIPYNNPSAHAEMSAIRDATARLGHTDLSRLTLVTSCECCPMCLSAATGCKIEQIYFSATRKQAADAGFLDDDQYALMESGGIEKHARKVDDTTIADMRLDGHDAVVEIRYKGTTYRYFGDGHPEGTSADPTDLPIVQAIRDACKGHAKILSEEAGSPVAVFHPPIGTVIVSRNKPHPLSLVAADWARIGRVRGANPNKPTDDLPEKDTSCIQYINDEWEPMSVRAANGEIDQVPVERVWNEIKHPSAIHVTADIGRADRASFDLWKEIKRKMEEAQAPDETKQSIAY